MLFTSFEFVGMIAILFLLYYLVPDRHQWKLLLLFDGYFVLSMGKAAGVMLCGMVVMTYIFTGIIEKQNKKRAGHTLYVCLICNLFLIVGWKLILEELIAEKIFQGALSGKYDFIGLSYYGLMLMGYAISVKRKNYPAEKNVFRLFAFAGFFPALVQGPISKFGSIKDSLFEKHRFDGKRAVRALERILYGYFKKLVIADRIAPVVGEIIGNTGYSGTYVFAGMLFYAIQLYGDFTGGIDITLGIAEFLGIDLPENFQNPFSSKSLSEYWRRWHISLGEWMKEYIFYPVSVSKPMQKCSRIIRRKYPVLGKKLPVYTAALITWFCTGFWHGSQFHFIFWGLANGVIIILSQELKPLYEGFHRKFPIFTENPYIVPVYGDFQAIRTFLLVCALRMTDCYQSVGVSLQMFSRMFTDFHMSEVAAVIHLAKSSDVAVLVIGVLVMYLVGKAKKQGDVRIRIESWSLAAHLAIMLVLSIVILIFGAYGVGYDAAQFIYNQV